MKRWLANNFFKDILYERYASGFKAGYDTGINSLAKEMKNEDDKFINLKRFYMQQEKKMKEEISKLKERLRKK